MAGQHASGDGSKEATAKLLPLIGCKLNWTRSRFMIQRLLIKKSNWSSVRRLGYDIGYGGVDHVLASGEDINILVLDTEVYQWRPVLQVHLTAAIAKFAAGKAPRRKTWAQWPHLWLCLCGGRVGADQAQCKSFQRSRSVSRPVTDHRYSSCTTGSI